ncbi:MAG: GNAT family N-acetyltransferase [Nocardioides sp.]|uniref:GNAT family N-acetyltransferase n=1 Tax=Nocardioides sp. TaxID=35761 RepID=UPI000C97CB42|nr:GNAT family N-acetyltransferase [Nocardioides sp.]MAS55943.1 AAA family ATPase [Pimelobacter sp.]MDE0775488.1 GNAT family N-acetyltransferase [Nocardioides sp.]
MSDWTIRDAEFSDLEALVRLDDASTTAGQPPAFHFADVVSAVARKCPAVLAISSDGGIVGAAISSVSGDEAWVLRLSLAPSHRNRGMGSALLGQLEQRLIALGVQRIRVLFPADETGARALLNNGFTERAALSLFEKREFTSPQSASLLRELGGLALPAGLWDRVSGMKTEKALIERKVVLPLARPAQAVAHGVAPPRAVMLFGPPGTGKTTFARAVASRLMWPFLELFPSRLASSEGGLAAGINQAFSRISDIDNVVVFIDEVEEVAAKRVAAGSSSAVVNELLKALVTFRERDGRLLICATNSVSSLDPAFLRHGRFDYVLPIGPPDSEARRAMWIDHLATAGEDVDLERLVSASADFTPADITHVARTVAQQMFEHAVDTGARRRATEADYVTAMTSVRPTLNKSSVDQFQHDIETFARA